jgi:branched-chain amino acid aminotransferase
MLSHCHADPHAYPPGVAFLDGQYVPIGEAKVSVLDYGFLHSDATYDTVHVWKGAFFRLDLHLDRFFAGMERLRMTIPLGRQDVRDVLHACVALSGHQNAYVEMICTRGTSPTFSRDPRDAVNRFMAFAVPWGSVANPEQMRRGLRLATSGRVRIPPASVDPSIKNYHWLDLVMGLYEAYDRGAETALLLDSAGNVAEGPGFNIFAVQEDRLVTPATGVLPGITRRTVLDLVAELDLIAEVRDLPLAELASADEAFATSTAGGIMPVTRLDGAPIGSGEPGPVTARLVTLYWERHAGHPWAEQVSYRTLAGTEPSSV